jgi:hypothetical protein
VRDFEAGQVLAAEIDDLSFRRLLPGFQLDKNRDDFHIWIGILNHLFLSGGISPARPVCQCTAELSKSCGLVGALDGRVGGGAEIAGARGAGDRATRSPGFAPKAKLYFLSGSYQSLYEITYCERRASSAVRLRWQAVFGSSDRFE